jgi:hypothetical protein
MAMTFITGIDSAYLDQINLKEGTAGYQIVEAIIGGNDVESLYSDDLTKILLNMRQDMPRINGTPIPVEETVVKFAKGDTQTASSEWLTKRGSFKHKVAPGYTVEVFDFSEKDIRDVRNLNKGSVAPLMDKIVKRTTSATNTYKNTYTPNSILADLLSGTSFRDELPALDGGTGRFWSNFGFARGEQYNNYLLPTATSMTRNHYLTIKGNSGQATQSTDIQRAIKLLKETVHYGKGGGSQKGVLVLGNYFTIQNLSNIYGDTLHQDKGIFGETIAMYDAYFKPVEGFHDDFLLFIDMSFEGKLIAHGINEDPEQRGFGMIIHNDTGAFEKLDDIKGNSLFIFEEENFVVNRLSGVLLDVNSSRANTNGEMTTDSETVLNTWIEALRDTYIDEK